MVGLSVDLEEYLQYRQEDGEGEHIEQGCQYVHGEGGKDESFVSGEVLAHLLIELFHRLSSGEREG